MNALNTDLILHIATFASPSEALAIVNVNKETRAESGDFSKTKYQETFGEIKLPNTIESKVFRRLFSCSDKQPNISVNHNTYQAPESRLERWKWIVGVENRLDLEVQENYKQNLTALETTQATSILQLKHQMQAFWHTDRQLKDYTRFKFDEIQKNRTTRVQKIFFGCLGFLFRLFYNPTRLAIGKDLERRSRTTFANIGGFALDGKQFNVVAYHILADERSESNHYKNDQEDPQRYFCSVSSGKTYVGIFAADETPSLERLGHLGSHTNFQALIGRSRLNPHYRFNAQPPEPITSGVSAENSIDHGKANEGVLNQRRYLLIGNTVEYRNSTDHPQGSDRALDQKLTQIMIEMGLQNQVKVVTVSTSRNDAPVVRAGGFEFDRYSNIEIMQKLKEFRAIPENRLFPPYHNYRGSSAEFSTQTCQEKNVLFSRGEPKSWQEIIAAEPILKPRSAVLPEYWVTKPNIIEEKDMGAYLSRQALANACSIQFPQ